MTARALLSAALARLTPPEAWTAGAYARDTTGRPVQPTSPRAVSWCLMGAMLAEGYKPGVFACEDAKASLFAATRARFGEAATPDDVQDLGGHQLALELLVDALARTRGR